MKPVQTILMIMFSGIFYWSQAQTISNCVIKYSYDAAGNRIKRYEQCGGGSGGGGGKTGENIAETKIHEENNDMLNEADFDIAVLFPNPTSSSCIISLTKPVSDAKLMLYDTQGKMMLDKNVNGDKFQLDLAKYSNGTYIVIIGTNERRVSKNVVKN